MGMMDALNEFGRGLGAISKSGREDRAVDRALDAEERKLRLQNELAMQLEERKQLLAEKFPQMKQAIATPWGAIVSRSSNGVQVEFEDPEVKAAYIRKQETASDKQAAQATAEPIRAGATVTAAEAAAARAAAAQTAADAKTEPKPATPVQNANLRAKARAEAIAMMDGRDIKKKERVFNALSTTEQEALIQARLDVYGASGPAAAAPSDPAAGNRYMNLQ